jgi:hypothetical protein
MIANEKYVQFLLTMDPITYHCLCKYHKGEGGSKYQKQEATVTLQMNSESETKTG